MEKYRAASSILGRPSSRISKSEKELFEKYLNDGKGKCQFAITQFAALSFVQPEHTGPGFEALLEYAYIKKHSIIFKGYLDYFEKQWVGKEGDRLERKEWGHCPLEFPGCLPQGEMKTTSIMKVWHKHLKVKFGLTPSTTSSSRSCRRSRPGLFPSFATWPTRWPPRRERATKRQMGDQRKEKKKKRRKMKAQATRGWKGKQKLKRNWREPHSQDPPPRNQHREPCAPVY
ncbi:hypothetical protein DSO57_1037344 [Entomophthora muscae]|uniref:Uncharacterized protein n=1 Tax=Entomophthora muscae TaxID=34485 RepID=A0ACC2TWW6_9FUNG|nr:hypothetical protein DSO57_1037344 [Entomophthora muscae]